MSTKVELPPYPHPYKEVRRVTERVTVTDIERYLLDDEPVLLAGDLEGMPFFERLRGSPDDGAVLQQLAQSFGKRRVPVATVTTRGRMPGDPKHVEQMPFDELANRMAAQLGKPTDTCLYMQNQPVAMFPELAWKPPLVSTRSDWEHAHSGLWIGSGGQTVMLHYDNSFNFVCMMNGYKRFSLLPMEVLPDLYAVFDPATNVTASTVRLLDIDDARFPRFRRALAHLRVVVVGPGDTLFVPPHWFHHVESFGLNVMVSNWGVPFSLSLWRTIGKNRAELLTALEAFPRVWVEYYASQWDTRVFGHSADRVPVPGDPEPAGRARVEQLLAESAELFAKVPEIWRRHGKLAYDYFVFERHGTHDHMPGGHAGYVQQFREMLKRGERLSPLG